jgi:hypothetical protein
MFHSILDALMAVLWLGSTVGCALLAVLMRPRGKADGEKTEDKSEPGKEGGAQ